MASVTKSDIPEISAFMSDFWNLIKKYWIPEDPGSPYWDDLVQEIKNIYDKYRHPFVKQVLFAFLDYEDAEMKRRYSNDAGTGI